MRTGLGFLSYALYALIAVLSLGLGGAAKAQTTGTGPHVTWLTSASPAQLSVVYHFTGHADGGNPIGGVVLDSTGTIYGETFRNGASSCSTSYMASVGCGTVYSFTQAGGLKVLASFTGPNGAHGNATLVEIGQTLYGVTQYGGSGDDGVVFSVGTNGSNFTLLHQFTGADGNMPVAIVAARNGTLYGITQSGGNSNDGVLFSLTPAGSYTVLHNFAQPVNDSPNSLVIASDGTLVGSTKYGGPAPAGCRLGCGTVFTDVPATGVFTTVYAFSGSEAVGSTPIVGSLGPGPTIYGIDNSYLFTISAAGYQTIGYLDYYGVGGGAPSGPIYTQNGVLYGLLGGNANGEAGVIYSFFDYTFNNLDGWNVNGSGGGGPIAQPFLTKTNYLIGTNTEYGFCTYCGTIWAYGPLPPPPTAAAVPAAR